MREDSVAEYEYINNTGVIVPNTGQILAEVQAEYKNAFGQDLNVDPSTPQGLLIAAETLARSVVVRNNAALANQINPNLAGGVFLDALLALTGAERKGAVSTRVSCVLTGVAGTIVPAGSQARDVVNNAIFASESTVTLTGSPATATVFFSAVIPGPLTVDIATLTQIVTAVLGWETISNPAAGVSGSTTQSDSSARSQRKVTLASQGSALPEAIIAALYNVPQVKSLSFRENYTDSNMVIGPVTLVPHSIYACVDGGTEQAVAAAILSKKSGGCNYNGTITENVTDEASGQIYPVKFDRPALIPILVRATVSADVSIEDPQSAVIDAILKYATGQVNGEPGLIVGAAVSCFELAGAVTCLYPGIYVKNMETTDNLIVPAYSNAEIPIAINQKATVDAGSITVVIS